jgi:hypothetical protein
LKYRIAEINETLQTAATPAVSNLTFPREKSLRWIALSAIVALAASLRMANLNAIGYANHYYTAAVVSMLNFLLRSPSLAIPHSY